MKVKITKVGISKNPKVLTPYPEIYKYGKINEGVSVPIDYWIIGELINPIIEGQSIRVNREVRNGVKISGLFKTSFVTKIESSQFKNTLTIETENSKYLVEYLSE